jgi:hypothetical protein
MSLSGQSAVAQEKFKAIVAKLGSYKMDTEPLHA